MPNPSDSDEEDASPGAETKPAEAAAAPVRVEVEDVEKEEDAASGGGSEADFGANSTTLSDDAPTPGREEAPLCVYETCITGEFTCYDRGQYYVPITVGPFEGKTLWWDGYEHYQLGDGDGRFVRFIRNKRAPTA